MAETEGEGGEAEHAEQLSDGDHLLAQAGAAV